MIGEQTPTEERLSALLDGEVQHSNGQRKTINDLRRSLKYARSRAEKAEADAEKQKQDKLRYKDFCVRIFTNTVDFHAEGKTISVPWLIKEYKPFYWGVM